MGIIVLVILLVAVCVGLAFLLKALPMKAKIILIIALSVGLAWLHFLIAKKQLNTIGFAASNREANYVASYIGYGLGALGLLNAGVVFKSRRVAVVVLCVLLGLLPVLYFLSW